MSSKPYGICNSLDEIHIQVILVYVSLSNCQSKLKRVVYSLINCNAAIDDKAL